MKEKVQSLYEKLRADWNNLKPSSFPPSEKIQIWNERGCGLWIGVDWGPPVPYPPIGHPDGTMNHGYVLLKSNPAAIDSLPEVDGYPELRNFLRVVNSDTSVIESVGCEKGFFDDNNQDVAKWYIGSYVDLIFSDPLANDNPENFLRLASYLFVSVEGCEKW
jgi:hypothetical protein